MNIYVRHYLSTFNSHAGNSLFYLLLVLFSNATCPTIHYAWLSIVQIAGERKHKFNLFELIVHSLRMNKYNKLQLLQSQT